MTGMPRSRAWTKLGNVVGNPGTDDNQVLIAKRALAVLTGLDADAVIEEHRNLFPELFRRFGVGDGDGGATFGKKKSAGDAGLPQPDHQRAFALNIHDKF